MLAFLGSLVQKGIEEKWYGVLVNSNILGDYFDGTVTHGPYSALFLVHILRRLYYVTFKLCVSFMAGLQFGGLSITSGMLRIMIHWMAQRELQTLNLN